MEASATLRSELESALAGEVFILFGNSNPASNLSVGDTVPWNSEYLHKRAISIMGENPEDGFGRAIAGGGDINGDGYDDIVIGAPNYNNGKGRAYVIFGRQYVAGNANAFYTRPFFGGGTPVHGPGQPGIGRQRGIPLLGQLPGRSLPHLLDQPAVRQPPNGCGHGYEASGRRAGPVPQPGVHRLRP